MCCQRLQFVSKCKPWPQEKPQIQLNKRGAPKLSASLGADIWVS